MKFGNLNVYGVIYKITNKVNNKVYIGQTTRKNGFNGRYCYKGNGVERVKIYHEKNKSKGFSYNEYLLNSINKYGVENFKVCEIYDLGFSKDELNIKEETYIKLYRSFDKRYGYNFTSGGEGGIHSYDSKSKDGTRIVCLNDNKQFKSIREASEYYNVPTHYINKASIRSFYSDYRNYKYIRFKKIDRALKENERLCSCCGVIMKLEVISKTKSPLIPKKYNNNKYCNKCLDKKYRESKDKNKKMEYGMKNFYTYNKK